LASLLGGVFSFGSRTCVWWWLLCIPRGCGRPTEREVGYPGFFFLCWVAGWAVTEVCQFLKFHFGEYVFSIWNFGYLSVCSVPAGQGGGDTPLGSEIPCVFVVPRRLGCPVILDRFTTLLAL
jgi:hypothetical protein